MKTKAQKRTEARAIAEKQKAAKKAARMSTGSTTSTAVTSKGIKGKSLVPSSKKKK